MCGLVKNNGFYSWFVEFGGENFYGSQDCIWCVFELVKDIFVVFVVKGRIEVMDFVVVFFKCFFYLYGCFDFGVENKCFGIECYFFVGE